MFICYKRLSGQDFAEAVKKAAKEIKIRAFLDVVDIPVTFKGTEQWENARNAAVVECKIFMLILTSGFELSQEIKKELSLARSFSDKEFIYFRHKGFSPIQRIVLNNEELDLGKQQQISFNTVNDLVRKFQGLKLENPTFFEAEWDSFLMRNKKLASCLLERRKDAIEEGTGDEEGHIRLRDSRFLIEEAILEIGSHALSKDEALKILTIFPGWDFAVNEAWNFVDFLSSKTKDLRRVEDVEKSIIAAINQGYNCEICGFGKGEGSYFFREIMNRANQFASGTLTLAERKKELSQPLCGFAVNKDEYESCCKICGTRLAKKFVYNRYSTMYEDPKLVTSTCPNLFCPNYNKDNS
jgi:hypothetical protein